jgi:O-antigen ligase
VGVSAVWAGSDAAVVRALLRYAPNAALFPVVYFAVRERRQLSWLMGAFVLGALLSALYGLFVTAGGASTAQAAEGRLTGATAEANELVALLAAIVVGGRWRGRITLFAAMVIALGVIYFAAASPTGLERITNPSSSGRDDIWTVGWRIVEHNPVVGIGADNFRLQTVRYLVQPGVISADQYIVTQPLVAHNIYLEMLAELGIVGLALFVTIIGVSIACMARAIATARASGDTRLELLSRALIVGLVALLAADCFASEQYSKQLWLLLALGPVVLAASRKSAVTARPVSWRDELALLPRRVTAARAPVS